MRADSGRVCRGLHSCRRQPRKSERPIRAVCLPRRYLLHSLDRHPAEPAAAGDRSRVLHQRRGEPAAQPVRRHRAVLPCDRRAFPDRQLRHQPGRCLRSAASGCPQPGDRRADRPDGTAAAIRRLVERYHRVHLAEQNRDWHRPWRAVVSHGRRGPDRRCSFGGCHYCNRSGWCVRALRPRSGRLGWTGLPCGKRRGMCCGWSRRSWSGDGGTRSGSERRSYRRARLPGSSCSWDREYLRRRHCGSYRRRDAAI